MATKNFFDLLGDDENEDPSQVGVRVNSIPAEPKPAAGTVTKSAATSKTPTKPTSTGEADSQKGQYDGARGGRGSVRGGRGGRGGYGDRDGASREAGGYKERNYNNDRTLGQTRDGDGFVGPRSLVTDRSIRTENGEGRSHEGVRGGGRGRARGGRGHAEGEERLRRREFDRHSGNARGNETEKRSGAGRGNWGTDVDSTLILVNVEAIKDVEVVAVDIKPEQEESADATAEEVAADAVKDEEEEDNEMTLEEYEKVLVQKRKALESEKTSERKVEVDKAFEKMHLVDNKKREGDIFIKLGQEKEKVKREAAEREEKSRKPVNINEFLKPAEGEKYYGPPSNRGRGGRGGRGDRREGADRREGSGRGDRDSSRISFSGRVGGNRNSAVGVSAPKIEDQAQFPTLGGK